MTIAPHENRVATFRALGDRVRDLRDELSQLVAEQHIAVVEMGGWEGYAQNTIADICGLSQPTVSRLLKRTE